MEKITTIPNQPTSDAGTTEAIANLAAQSSASNATGVGPDSAVQASSRKVVRAVVERSNASNGTQSTEAADVAIATESELMISSQRQTIESLTIALDLVAIGLEHSLFKDATDALAAELATRLNAERVSIGFLKGPRIHLYSLSNKARFSHRTDVIRDIEAAMQEAVDQADTLVFPLPDYRPARVTWAHARLSRRQQHGGAMSVPLSVDDEVVGAMTAESHSGELFSADQVVLLETLAALISPLLQQKETADRSLFDRIRFGLVKRFKQLIGPEQSVPKILLTIGLMAVAARSLINTDFRITSRSELEGAVRRAVVSPMSGFIAQADVRPGDEVRSEQVLATLEDRDLQLERTKLLSRKQQVVNEYRVAIAKHDRAQVSILKSQLDQIQAELARAEALLSRTRLQSPFDGVIVSGDLSQALGAPVERGQVLLEVAPLDRYRVVVKTDERDLRYVHAGQHGTLVLAAHPEKRHPITVTSITPVAAVEEGRTFFRVEAALDTPTTGLRPRMDGVAKLDVGERSLLWIWTRRLVDIVSLWLWTNWH